MGEVPQVGEVTRLGEVPQVGEVIVCPCNLSFLFDHIPRAIIKLLQLHDRWGDPPQVTSPVLKPPLPGKQALTELDEG